MGNQGMGIVMRRICIGLSLADEGLAVAVYVGRPGGGGQDDEEAGEVVVVEVEFGSQVFPRPTPKYTMQMLGGLRTPPLPRRYPSLVPRA